MGAQEELGTAEVLLLQIPHPLQKKILSMNRHPDPAVIPADPTRLPGAVLSQNPAELRQRFLLCHTRPDAVFPGPQDFLLTGNATTNPKYSPSLPWEL